MQTKLYKNSSNSRREYLLMLPCNLLEGNLRSINWKLDKIHIISFEKFNKYTLKTMIFLNMLCTFIYNGDLTRQQISLMSEML